MMGGDMAAQAAQAQMYAKLSTSGVEAPGTIDAIRAVGGPDFSGATPHEFDVTITPAGGSPYQTTIRQGMLPAQMEGIAQGMACTVKYDPDNPTERGPLRAGRRPMGLFKDMKGAISGAKQLGDHHGGMPSIGGAFKDVKALADDRGEGEVLKNGTPAKAIVKSFAMPSATEKFTMQIELEVHPPGGGPTRSPTSIRRRARRRRCRSAWRSRSSTCPTTPAASPCSGTR